MTKYRGEKSPDVMYGSTSAVKRQRAGSQKYKKIAGETRYHNNRSPHGHQRKGIIITYKDTTRIILSIFVPLEIRLFSI